MLPRTKILLLWILVSSLLANLANSSARAEALDNLRETNDVSFLSFSELGVFDKLPASRIHAIQQDARGFLWIGTRQGLYRYDGIRMKAFLFEENDESTIPDNNVWEIFIDSKERIWVGTLRGIALYSERNDSFKRYLSSSTSEDPSAINQTNAILAANDGTVYTATENGTLYQFDDTQENFIPVSDYDFGEVKSIAIDAADRLWIGSNKELFRFDRMSGDVARFTEGISLRDQPSANYVNTILYRNDEEIWLGTSGNGVVILDTINSQSKQLGYDNQPESYVNQISIDPQARVWVASNAGINLFDAASHNKLPTPGNLAAEPNLPPSGVTALWVDHQGSIWAGSNYDGVRKASNRKRFEPVPFHRYNPEIPPEAPVSAFVEDGQGNLWVGYQKAGVAQYSQNGDLLRTINPLSKTGTNREQPLLEIFEDSRGIIWMGTYRDGLFRFDPQAEELTHYTHNPDDPNSIAGHDIRDIAEDAEGNIWTATHGNGIIKFDFENDRFENYSSTVSPSIEFDLPTDWINTILIDNDQNIWAGSQLGLTRITADLRSSRTFQASSDDPNSLSNSQVTHLIQDSQGRIWVATQDGLNRYNPDTQDFRNYSMEQGLPNRNLTSIVEDLDSNLWIGSLGGLVFFDPTTQLFKEYSAADGLPSNDFFDASVGKGSNGTLYFGQNKGLVRFNPVDIIDDTQAPPVYITGLQINGAEIRPNNGKKSVLKIGILATKEIELGSTQSGLTIEFVAIDFINPTENQYRYKLENFESDWIETQGRPAATYTNLPPGDYTFQVQAANSDGYWNLTGDTLRIRILPTFFNSRFFKVLVLALVILVPLLLYYLRVKSIKKEARRLEQAVDQRTKDLRKANTKLADANQQILDHWEHLEETVKLRTKELEVAKIKAERSDNLKSAFLANMSHEIRTPMNAIIGFLHFLENKDLSDEDRTHFNHIIRQSSTSLMSLIDDILDLSAIEAGEAEITRQPTNLSEICEELCSLFRESLKSQKEGKVTFAFSAERPKSLEHLTSLYFSIDPHRLKQILWNLLSNALKFTEEGEVKLSYRIYETQGASSPYRIEFRVKDSGIGIPQEEHERIFSRFHKVQSEGEKLYRGTGLGLAITQSLTLLMDGKVSVDSTVGEGTTFIVDFPYEPYQNENLAPPSAPQEHARVQDGCFAGRRLLVVEDEPPNFQYIERVLRNTNIAIEWAQNGSEALEKFKVQDFDIILLDLKIPVFDGYEVARKVRETGSKIPIVTQSAFAMREDHQKSLDAGANQHLPKPFRPEQLIDTVAQYLSQSPANN